MIDELVAKLKAREQQASAEFITLARKLAGGGKVRPEEAAAVLSAAGRTPDDLAREVHRFERRHELAEQLKDAATTEKRVAAVRQQIAAADRELTAARLKHAETVEPLHAEMEDLKRITRNRDLIESELRETAEESMVQEHQRISDEIAVLSSRVIQLQRQVARRSEAVLCEEQAQASEGVRRDRLNEEAQKLKQSADRAATELAEAEPRLRELEKRQAELWQVMLRP